MHRGRWICIAATLVFGCTRIPTGPAGDVNSSRPAHGAGFARERPAGEGVICALGISSAMKEVGDRCFAGQDPDFQAELARAVARLDEYVLTNSEWTPSDLEAFKKDQSEVGAPEARLCREDLTRMYKEMAAQGPGPVKESTDELVARPGKPSWGDCL
jgi:hypothetical protein